MPLSPGTRLGPYEILAVVGTGGMGEVYKARDTRLHRLVAIKRSHERFSDRFEREAQAVAALNHPNICQLYDVGSDYLVMELIEGSPLGPVDHPRKAIQMAVQIADGLATAHAAGFVHRDLKPDNILLTADGRIKILDFGLAKTSPSSDEQQTRPATAVGAVMGTAAYMSPEQARGQQVDARSDQFSLGLILHELVSGTHAFQRGTAAETMAAIIREDAPPLPDTVPTPLRWVIERCLAKDPGDRYDSTRDLYRDLRQIRERAHDSSPSVSAPTVTRTRRPIMWMAAVALVAGLAGFAAAAWWPLPPAELPSLIPFATESELQAMPRWSPDGDRIAYVASVNGVLQVFIKSLDSPMPTQLTHEAQSSWSPLWSADATRIYFLTGVRPNTSIRSIAVAGGPSELVLDRAYKVDLSPDGQTLAALLSEESGRYQLVLSSPPGSQPKPYTKLPLGDTPLMELRFDTSGRYLGLGIGGRLFRIPVEGGDPLEPTGLAPVEGRFTWSNDLRWVISDHAVGSSATHLTMTDFRSGITRVITTGPSVDSYPSLSPDGQTLTFQSGELGFDVIEVPTDGSAPRESIATSRLDLAPSWAPDGNRSVYISDRAGVPEIWLRNHTDGSERRIATIRQFPPGNDRLFDTVVSPDGARVAYRVQGVAGPTIWISPLSGEAPVRLWSDPTNSPQRGPSWAPDGNSIAYYGAHDGRFAILKTRVGASAPPELVVYMSRNFPPRWSPRGDLIAYREGETLRVVAPDGSQSRTVSNRVWETYGWSADGAALLGITYDAARRLQLRRVDLRGTETVVADLGPVPPAFDLADSFNEFAYRGFSLHPNGKSFLTSVLKMRTQIYIMKDFNRSSRLADALFFRPSSQAQ